MRRAALEQFAHGVETIAAALRDLAREVDAPSDYSSVALPPDVHTRTTFARHCREIPEARKIGRVWQVSREAWEQHRSAQRCPKVDEEAALRSALGLRIVGSAR